jgi:hypothetical protein
MLGIMPCLGNTRKTVVGVLCCLLLASPALSGCSSYLESNTGLTTDKLCTAPCWHNITPGVSDEDDVGVQLMHDSSINKDTVEYGLVGEGGAPLLTFRWQDQDGRINKVRLRDGKVLRIEISLDYDLTLEEIVDEYGPPERIYVPVCAEDHQDRVFIDYPSSGLQFSTPLSIDFANDPVEKSVALSEALVMADVVYFAPTSLREMLSKVFLLSPDEVDCRMSNSHEWQGFGRVTITEP